MKVLEIRGDGDFSALHFLNHHGGTSVDEIIANPDKFLPSEENNEYEQWNLNVLEFEGTVNSEFLYFIRNEMMSYDDSKHRTFYVEGEIVE